jgi:1,4-dihydroxy-2-naphthoyl-CoA hydrolase
MNKSHGITLEKLRAVFLKNQLPESFGIDITEVGEDSVTGELIIDERHLRPGNIMNGGASLVLIETLGSVSSCLFIDIEKQNSFGIQVNANHIGIAKPGDKLIGKTTPVHIGRTTHVWDVKIINQNDKLISSGRITMLVTEQSMTKV